MEPLLLIPGALGTARTDFAPQIEEFSTHFRVIAPDLQRDYRRNFLERDAADLAALLTGRGIETFFAAGWSDGATTAVLLALAHPERVKKLVIWGGNSFVSAEDIERIERVRHLSAWSRRMRESLEAVYGDGLQEVWSRYCDVIGDLYRAGGEICRERLGQIRCPTLILHGDQDPLVPAFHPQVFREEIAGSQYHSFPEGRHNIHLAHADKFNRVVRE